MSKTNNESEIKTKTGLDLGKLFYKDKKLEIEKKGEYIFDLTSGNFHYLPIVNQDNRGILNEYLTEIKNLRSKIKEKLGKRSKEFGYEVLGDGENGNINPTPGKYDKELNHFFRYLYVKKNNKYFCLNFMRWEIDNNVLNCYLGEIQCDVTTDKRINHKVDRKKEYLINYPQTSKIKDYEKKDKKFLGVFNYDGNEAKYDEIIDWFLKIINSNWNSES